MGFWDLFKKMFTDAKEFDNAIVRFAKEFDKLPKPDLEDKGMKKAVKMYLPENSTLYGYMRDIPNRHLPNAHLNPLGLEVRPDKLLPDDKAVFVDKNEKVVGILTNLKRTAE